MLWFNKPYLVLVDVKRRYLMMAFCTTGVALLACFKSAFDAVIMELMPPINAEFSVSSACNFEEHVKQKEQTIQISMIELSVFNALFYAGIALAAFGGALLAEAIGPKMGMFLGVLGGSLTVTAIALNDPIKCSYCVYTIRTIQGIWQALYSTSVNVCIIRWVPPNERSFSSAVVYSSLLVGLIIPSISTFIISFNEGSGLALYEPLYVAYGLAGMFWASIFFLSASSLPETDQFMSNQESTYLHTYAGYRKPPPWWDRNLYPWKRIMTSRPVWIGIVSNVGSEMIMIVNVHYFAKYMKAVLKLSARIKGIIVMTNGMITVGLGLMSGLMADKLINRFKVKKDLVRKLYAVTGVWIPVAGLVLGPEISLLKCQRLAAVSFMGICLSFVGLSFSSQKIIMMELSPRFGGIAFGLMLTFQGLGGVCFNVAAGYAITSALWHRWMFTFFIVSFVPLLSTYIFVIWGTTEVQPWNELKPQKDSLRSSVQKSSQGNPRLSQGSTKLSQGSTKLSQGNTRQSQSKAGPSQGNIRPSSQKSRTSQSKPVT